MEPITRGGACVRPRGQFICAKTSPVAPAFLANNQSTGFPAGRAGKHRDVYMRGAAAKTVSTPHATRQRRPESDPYADAMVA